MRIKLWQKITVGFLGTLIVLVLVGGSLTQIQQGRFFNPVDTAEQQSSRIEPTFAEKVEQARKNLNFGQ